MKKELHCKLVDMLADVDLREVAFSMVIELAKTAPSVVVAAYEKVMQPKKDELPKPIWAHEYWYGQFVEFDDESMLVYRERYKHVISAIWAGRKVEAIKEIRSLEGFGLKEARDVVVWAIDHSAARSHYNQQMPDDVNLNDSSVRAVATRLAAALGV